MANRLDSECPSASAIPPAQSALTNQPPLVGAGRGILNPLTLANSQPMNAPPRERPGRYEDNVDTRPLTPPASSHNMQLVFDSSKIYDNHPRKYRLLLERDLEVASYPNPAQSISGGSLNPSRPPGDGAASVCVEHGHVVATETSINTSSATPGPLTAEAEAPLASVAQHPTSRTRVPEHLTISKAPKASMIKPGSVRDPDTGTAVKPSYIPQDFLQSFKASRTKPSTAAPARTDPQGTSSVLAPHRPAPQQPSSITAPQPSFIPDPQPSQVPPAAAAGVQRGGEIIPDKALGTRWAGWRGSAGSLEVEANCLMVQPEPRRLFGFGPHYHPLPETVCHTDGPALSKTTQPAAKPASTGLSDTIKREGITGVGYTQGIRTGGGVTGARAPSKAKTSPTSAELNSWLTGPF